MSLGGILSRLEMFDRFCRSVNGVPEYRVEISMSGSSIEFSTGSLDEVKSRISRLHLENAKRFNMYITASCIVSGIVPTAEISSRFNAPVDGVGRLAIYYNRKRYDYGVGKLRCMYGIYKFDDRSYDNESCSLSIIDGE